MIRYRIKFDFDTKSASATKAVELTEGEPISIVKVGPKKTHSIIYNPFSSSLARRSAFCKSQDNLEISFMDTNGDLGIMSHVGHLRRTLELSQENG